MKSFFVFLFLYTLSANAGTYYVSPSGSNTNSGSMASPFATLQKAHDVAAAGDTLYLRGGNYHLTQQVTITKSGTSGHPLCIFNYPGEAPVLDANAITTTTDDVLNINVSWMHLRGLEVKNGPSEGVMLNGNNNIMDQMNVHHNGRASNRGWGVMLGGGSSNNLIVNNDVHHNRDLTGGNSDGITLVVSGTGNVLRGNRLWRNSDDGIDTWMSTQPIIIENNWLWENGYDDALTPTGGNGMGIKLGGGTTVQHGNHIVWNNLMWHNADHGIHDNSQNTPAYVYNNTACRNQGVNYGFYGSGQSVLKNNLSFGSGVSLFSGIQQSYNSWNLSVTVSTADFASLDFSGALNSRQADGSLPTLDFLKLVSESDLINKGTIVGIPYSGSAPDLGAYEFGSSTAVWKTDSKILPGQGFVVESGTFTGLLGLRLLGKATAGSSLKIFDGMGRKIADLTHQLQNGRAIWNASGHAAGLYIVMLRDHGYPVAQKVVLVK